MLAQSDAQLVTEVHELLAAYGHRIDRCDADGWADLFHPDGTSAGPGRATLNGRGELREHLLRNPRPDVLHTVTNILVESVDDQVVHVRSHFVIHVAPADDTSSWSVMVAGSYVDQLVRHDGRLRFLSRSALPQQAPKAIDTPGNFCA